MFVNVVVYLMFNKPTFFISPIANPWGQVCVSF